MLETQLANASQKRKRWNAQFDMENPLWGTIFNQNIRKGIRNKKYICLLLILVLKTPRSYPRCGVNLYVYRFFRTLILVFEKQGVQSTIHLAFAIAISAQVGSLVV